MYGFKLLVFVKRLVNERFEVFHFLFFVFFVDECEFENRAKYM